MELEQREQLEQWEQLEPCCLIGAQLNKNETNIMR